MAKYRYLSTVGAIAILLSTTVIATPSYASDPVAPSNSICSLPGVILGTTGDDNIHGTSGNDVICGMGGIDRIDGLGGDDIIFGGDGDDTLIGGDGDDQIIGAIGQDDLSGSIGVDQIWGGEGNDTIDGGSEPDYIAGGPGADNLFGSSGADRLLGEAGDDSLNGGADLDTLDGGSGTDTCLKSPNDVVTSCYYDKSGPKLINISIDPQSANVDAGQANAKITLRYTLSDAGSGVDYAGFGFVDALQYGEWVKTSGTSEKLRQSDFVSIGAQIFGAADCSNTSDTHLGTCRVSGSITFGVFETSQIVPKNMLRSRYTLVAFDATDMIGLHTSSNGLALAKQKKAVSFLQTAETDRTAPIISNFEIIGPRNLDSLNSTLLVKVSFKDPGSHSIAYVEARYSLLKYPSQEIQLRSGILDDVIPDCPSEISAVNHACRLSGDSAQGNLILPLRVSGWETHIKKGLARVTSVEIADQSGNARNYTKLNKAVTAKSTIYESFGQNADTDHTAPTIVSLSATPAQIDTAVRSQKITLKLVARDTGTGLSTSSSSVYLTSSQVYSGVVGGCQYPKPQNLGKGRFLILATCEIPAHFPPGAIQINVNLEDLSANGNYALYSSEDLSALGFPFRIVNG